MSKTKVVPTAKLKKIHGTAVKLTAWPVYVLAIVASTLITATFVGDWYREILDMLPAPWRIGVTLIAAVVLLIFAFIDVIKDLTPNLVAVYSTLALTTVVSAISGGFAGWINTAGDWVFGLVDQWLIKAVPAGLGMGNDLWAIALTVAVVMLAERFNKKSPKAEA